MITKRSLSLFGHRTSVSLEEPFWLALHDIASSQNISLQKLVEKIDQDTKDGNLSSRLRVYVLNHFKKTTNNPK